MPRFDRFTLAACAFSGLAVRRRHERPPRTGRSGAGPGSQGISNETQLPTDWAPGRTSRGRRSSRAGHSSPIVWGDRIFVTAAVEGDVVPGAKAVNHTMDGKDFIHPDSVAADRKHTLKVLAIDAKSGKILWERTAYEGTVYDARHRRSSFAGPTAATDGTHGLRVLRPRGPLRVRLLGRRWRGRSSRSSGRSVSAPARRRCSSRTW